ncbi:MAG: hypothetical protein ACRD1J_02300, partial [Terriglobia bacterium]
RQDSSLPLARRAARCSGAMSNIFSDVDALAMLSVGPGLAQERARPAAAENDTRVRLGAGFLFLVVEQNRESGGKGSICRHTPLAL